MRIVECRMKPISEQLEGLSQKAAEKVKENEEKLAERLKLEMDSDEFKDLKKRGLAL